MGTAQAHQVAAAASLEQVSNAQKMSEGEDQEPLVKRLKLDSVGGSEPQKAGSECGIG